MSILLISFLKPESFSHKRSNEVSIVASSNIKLKWNRIRLKVKRSVKSIGVVKHEQKLSIFVDLLDNTVLSIVKFKFSGACDFQLVFSDLKTIE